MRDEVSEAALAHTDPNQVRAAYRRTTYLDERRTVMQPWAGLLDGRIGQKLRMSDTTGRATLL